MDLGDQYKDKNVLITGGGGFIGSNLAIRLVELGANVSIMTRLRHGGYNPFNLYPITDRIRIDFSDIRNKVAVERNVADQEIIFNLAAQVGERLSEINPQIDMDINIGGHKNILDACARLNPGVKILFSGSRLQYGKTDGQECVSETHPMVPISNYAKNKMIGEKMHQDFFEKGLLKTISFRIANPFGPRASISNPGYCIVNWFIGRALNNQPITIYGDGSQLRDYLFIDDLTEAMLIAGIKNESIGKTYNVGSGNGSVFRDMAQQIVNITGTKIKLEFMDWPTDAKNRETGGFVFDIGKIKHELGWAPRVSLEDGLRRTIEYYRKNITHYN
jgi:UDP-glucose 4-epimerase